jgi:hypothetical protein
VEDITALFLLITEQAGEFNCLARNERLYQITGIHINTDRSVFAVLY